MQRILGADREPQDLVTWRATFPWILLTLLSSEVPGLEVLLRLDDVPDVVLDVDQLLVDLVNVICSTEK